MAFDPEKALVEMAHGDAEALEFMRAFFHWMHALDDLIDRDKPAPIEEIVRVLVWLLDTLATNEFWRAHGAALLPVIRASAWAYLDSERYARDPRVLERITSQVLKSAYFDVLLAVAGIVGGWAHAREMARKYREYHFDPVSQPSTA